MTRQLESVKVTLVEQERHRLTERELHAWRTFFQMQEVLRSHIEQQLQACSGLSNADYTVLAMLADAPDGRLRACELSAVIGWEKSRLHHQLTRMCKRGLVQRCNGEARATYVDITAHGRAALTEAAPAHSAHVRRLAINPLTADQIDQLAEISAAILANLQHQAEPHTADQ